MEHRVSYTVIGAFVIVLGAVLVGGLLWIAAGGATGHYKDYVIYLETGAGSLNSNSPVLYHGVPVGRVESVSLSPGNPTKARVLLAIRDSAPIKQDTSAEVDTRGVTGAGYVNLSGGSPNSPLLEAGSGEEYPVIPTHMSGTTSLTTAAQNVAKHLIAVTNRLDKLLSDKNIKSVSDSLASISNLTARLAARSKDVDEALKNLNATLGNTRKVSSQLPRLVAQVQQTIGRFNTVAKEIGNAANGVGETATRLGTLTPRANDLLQQLSRTSRSLNALLEELRRQPSTLLFGRPALLGPGEHPPHDSGG